MRLSFGFAQAYRVTKWCSPRLCTRFHLAGEKFSVGWWSSYPLDQRTFRYQILCSKKDISTLKISGKLHVPFTLPHRRFDIIIYIQRSGKLKNIIDQDVAYFWRTKQQIIFWSYSICFVTLKKQGIERIPDEIIVRQKANVFHAEKKIDFYSSLSEMKPPLLLQKKHLKNYISIWI
jgi:hypothetical protein